jgi:hypothetical protein
LDNCYGQHGWKEFHRNRKDILAEFDKIIEQTANRPIQVAHGQGVEAYLRKWLTEFLPKKYGVTSGYIIPNIYNDSGTIYHYDIIIYNQFDAPVLWTEGNEDNSTQGKYRAIPAKYVVAIYEVKSRLTKKNVSDALEKLNQTKYFSEQLHLLYSCGIIFIELKESDNNKFSIIKELIKGKDIFGFIGGMVLRYESDDSCTALIDIYDVDPKEEDKKKHYTLPLAKPIDQLKIYLTEDGNLHLAESGGGAKLVQTSENNWSVSKQYGIYYQEGNKSIHLFWAKTNFADFCINLLITLEGLPYNDEKRLSFGQIFDNIELKKAPLQSEKEEVGKPFLNIKLGDEHDQRLIIDNNPSNPTIKLLISIENNGDTTAIISDDSFKTQCELCAKKVAVRTLTLQPTLNNSEKSLSDILKEKRLEIPYRLVYYSAGEADKEFFALEKTIRITETDIEFL